MAEAVKNNSRSRRPPTYLRVEGTQEIEVSSQMPKSKDTQRNIPDPCSLPVMARLISKFISSVNKKFIESKANADQSKLSLSSKKQPIELSKTLTKSEKNTKEEKASHTSKILAQGSALSGPVKSKVVAQGTNHPNEARQIKNETKSSGHSQKAIIPPAAMFSVQSMAKMNRQQQKWFAKGIDPTLLKEHNKKLSEEQATKREVKGHNDNLGRQQTQQQYRSSMWRSDSKLFKRAAFHIGIAYNIHIDKVKQNNPNYTTEDLDPTLTSRKMKAETIEMTRQRGEEIEKQKMHQQILLRQKAQLQARVEENARKQGYLKPIVDMKDQDKGNKPQANQYHSIQAEDPDVGEAKNQKEVGKDNKTNLGENPDKMVD